MSGNQKIKIMKRFAGILSILLITSLASYPQKLWTLEECIDYAIDNNIQLKRQQLHSESARNNYHHSLIRVLPSLTAFANHDYNSGRALNYETYQWETRDFEQGNLGMESRINIFSGFQNYNNIQQQRFLLLSRIEDVERTINNISLQIAAAFFQILLDMELVELAENQLEVSSFELESARSNFRVGNISRGRLLEIESQYAVDDYQLTFAQNNLDRSYLDLAQMMLLDSGYEFRIARPAIDEIDESAILNTVDTIYGEAETYLPQVRGAEYFLKSREKELSVVRGQQSPMLVFRGLFYTRYSELAMHPIDQGEYPYSSQLRDNQYRQLGISLSVPIFDRWNVRNRISNTKISVIDAQYQLDATKQELYSEIHQMHNSAVSAYKRYNSAVKAVLAASKAFESAREQLSLGLVNFVDYQYAQANLYRAQSSLAQAKYEYFLRSKILDFYLGHPLTID